MAEVLKTIPSEGKIKRVSKYVMILVTLWWFATTAGVLSGLMTSDEATLVGVTFDNWWKVMGVFLAILAANDNGVKYSTAILNK